jgi:hypothetical protein
MRPPLTLTRAQGYALTDTRQAARLSVDALVTHTGLYRWSDAHDCWVLDRAERIIKASGLAGTFVWQRGRQAFVREERP